MSIETGNCPKNICQSLTDIARDNLAAEDKLVDRYIEEVEAGNMTQGDVDRHLDGAEDAKEVNEQLFRYCSNNCSTQFGGCAMIGYGNELAGADYSTLTPKERKLYDFYLKVSMSRDTAQMASGMFFW